MKHLIFLSLVCLAVLLPPAVEGLFPALAVALGVGALLIAKGAFWGAVIAGLATNNNRGRTYYYRTPSSYYYRRHGKRKRDALPLQELEDRIKNFNKDEWFTDMSTKDEDDCGKRFVCELTARHTINPTSLADDEKVIVETFSERIDVKKGQVEFDLAAKVGREYGELRCAELYKRCSTATDTIMSMIRTEVVEINKIATGPTFTNRLPAGQRSPQGWPGAGRS